MDAKEAIRQIGSVIDDLDESSYKQGYDDCKTEMDDDVKKARDEGYEQGYKEGKDENQSTT